MEWRERPVPAAQWRAETPVVILRGGGLGQGMREAALPNQGCGGGGGGGGVASHSHGEVPAAIDHGDRGSCVGFVERGMVNSKV